MKKFMDCYSILGVPFEASQGEIKMAYRKQSKKVHPDNGGSASQFIRLRRAYDILSNENSRSKYNIAYQQFHQSQKGRQAKKPSGDEKKQKEKSQARKKSSDENNTKKHSKRIDWKRVGFFSIALNVVYTIIVAVIVYQLIDKQASFVRSQQDIEILESDIVEINNEKLIYEEELFEANTYIKNLEIENEDLVAAISLQTDNDSDDDERSENSSRDDITKEYFTIGSSKEEVKDIMGKPSRETDFRLRYEFSTIFINSDGVVSGWHDISDVLKVE
ncbi:J domain-containing protein [Salipaludibacillus sp. HK11]|uniref:J domain-containing protein n=1 Tax=Salipaludibacillus sp. HK11 TaxID=3394320 RepID=UPI0039FBF463